MRRTGSAFSRLLATLALALTTSGVTVSAWGEDSLRLKKDDNGAPKASETSTAQEASPTKETKGSVFSVKQPTPPKAAPTPIAKVKAIVPTGSESLDKNWNAHFAANVEAPGAVRETSRVLLEKRDFEQLIVMLQAALRNGQPQPWMYEALGLAMQLSNKPADEIERTLMSAADFATDPDQLLNLAMYMSKIGNDARAIDLYRQIAMLQPLRPEPYALGLQAAKRIDDAEGIEWASVGILTQSWPADQQEVFNDAFRVASARLKELQADPRLKDESVKFQKALDAALERDCIVKISWTGEAEVDLTIKEPSGSVCSLRDPRSAGGGVMGDDMLAKLGRKVQGVSEEVYICPQGFSGDYSMLLRRVWGKVSGGKVTVDLYTHYRGKDAQHQQMQIPLTDKDAEVRFNLVDGRRRQKLEEAQLVQATREQADISRHVLAQQLNQAMDPAVAAALAARYGTNGNNNNGNGNGRGLNGGLLGDGGVGFQPVIITLPEGTNMAVTGVISADRRYVRITALPIFSAVGDVTTFTFQGAAQQATGGGN